MVLVIVNEYSFWTTLLLPIFTTQLTVSNFNFMIIIFAEPWKSFQFNGGKVQKSFYNSKYI